MAGELKLDLGNTERELTSGETANLRKQLGLELGVDISSRADILSSTATTAQGILADTATQPGDLGTAAAANLGPSPGQILTIADPSLNTYDYLISNGTNGQIGWSVAEVRTNLGITNIDNTANSALQELLIANTIFVAKNGTDTRANLDDHDLSKPFLTCTAALAAATSGDLIVVWPGNYSTESALTGADGVNWEIKEGAISPSFLVTIAISFKVYGDVGGYFRVANTLADVECKGHVVGFAHCTAGKLKIGSSGGYIKADGGNLTCGNFGTFAEITYGGSLTIEGATMISDAPPPIGGLLYMSNNQATPCKLTIRNSRIESTYENVTLIRSANTTAAEIIIDNTTLIAKNAGTDGATIGISLFGDANSTQLKNCTVITAQNGTGVAKCIDATSAQTVYIQGVLNTTHVFDANIDWFGMDPMIDPGFTF